MAKLSKRERREAALRAKRGAEIQQRTAARQARRETAQSQPQHPLPERSTPQATNPFEASLEMMALIQLQQALPALHRKLQAIAQPLNALSSTPDCDESLVAVYQLVEMLADILPTLQHKVVEPMLDDASSPLSSATQAA